MAVRLLPRSIQIGVFAVILAGCGAKHSGLKSVHGDKSAVTTGYERVDQAQYTISGNPEVYGELRADFGEKSPALARSIETVQVSKLPEDEYKVIVKLNGRYFDLESLEFKGKVTTVGFERHGLFFNPKTEPKNFRSNFNLNVRCRSLDCQMMEMRLTERSGTYFKAEALWIYQERETHARFIESKRGGMDSLKVDPDETVSYQTSVVVIEGPSYSEVVVRRKDAEPEDEPVLVIQTDLVDTQERAENVQAVRVRGNTSSVQAVLQGNDPVTGDLMVDVESEDGSGAVRVIVESETSNRRNLQRINLNFGDRSINPNGISGDVDEYTEALNSYVSNPEVQRRMELWLSSGRACSSCRSLSKSRATKFLTNIQAVIPELREASKMTGASPEKAYLLAIESRFLTADNFPIEVSSQSNSSAAGPWQLQTGTAQEAIEKGGLPFQVYDLSGKTLNPNDDRKFFYESSVMALQYFLIFPEDIKHDPGLMFAGYYQGPYGMGRIVERHGGRNTSFEDLAKFGAIPKAADTADYVYSVIALRMIGMNPKEHGLDVPLLTTIPESLQDKIRKNP